MTNSAMATNTTSSFPDHWKDLLLLDQPLDMDAFKQSDLCAAERSLYMKYNIAYRTSGSISFIASMLLIIHILRSHECLSTTYHRLIFGLSVADIISSFCYILSSTMIPKEMGYLVPFASGNVATCDAQGFLVHFALLVSVGYNCSVCFYYLAIITYNKKYDYIKKKLEPWFHGVSIFIPLVSSIVLLATNAFNGKPGGVCYMMPHDPPHCVGYGEGYIPEGYSIPCGRGGPYDGNAKLRTFMMYGGFLWLLVIAPVIILVTMVRMFRSVAKIEKRMKKYGVGSLRLRATLTAQTANNLESRDFTLKLKKMGKSLFAICCFRCPPRAGDDRDPEGLTRSTKSNSMNSKKRAVLYMAVGYAVAWLLVFCPFFVLVVSMIVSPNNVADSLNIFISAVSPLQGFFNFAVFMASKVRNVRTMSMRRGAITASSDDNDKDQHLTWCQAFCKAYTSRRGLEDKNMRNNNLTERKRRATFLR
jgi:hypothetical protein